MTTQTTATAEIEKWLRTRIYTNFWLRSERKTRNPAGVDSGTGATSRHYQRWLRSQSQCFKFYTDQHRESIKVCSGARQKGTIKIYVVILVAVKQNGIDWNVLCY